MDKQTDVISRLQDEADLCRNEGADDIAALLDEAVGAIRDRNHDTQVGEKWREDSRLETWFPITAERMAALEAKNAETEMEDLRKSIAEILGESPTWPKHGNVPLAVSATVALLHAGCERMQKEIERHKPLMQAVEQILEDGHMNQEHLARLRAAWEAA